MSFRQMWRSGWDSNPRTRLRAYPISSRGRYDLFDTTPYALFADARARLQHEGRFLYYSIIPPPCARGTSSFSAQTWRATLLNRHIVQETSSCPFAWMPLRPANCASSPIAWHLSTQKRCPFRNSVHWRSGWDSNPRTRLRAYPISSRGRYDLFDTTPYALFADARARLQHEGRFLYYSIIPPPCARGTSSFSAQTWRATLLNRHIVQETSSCPFAWMPLRPANCASSPIAWHLSTQKRCPFRNSVHGTAAGAIHHASPP